MGCSEWGEALCGDELEGERLGREGLCCERKGHAQELLVGCPVALPRGSGDSLDHVGFGGLFYYYLVCGGLA